jgi:pantoate--beta-alanine ligase
MRIIKSISSMQRLALAWRRRGIRIGFVPTMGYLHAGHLSLVERARKAVGKRGKVVVSIYVNPTQFGPQEDFSKYPRDFRRDAALCRKAGADIVFAPQNEDMYPADPANRFSTYVVEECLSQGMEGASRPTHFRGVTTIVAKLFHIVLPDVAVFGAKDFQQAAVVSRMVRDLNFPVKVVVAPTLREPDGLAMSSRNKYLQGDLRQQATVLWRAIQKVKSDLRGSSKPLSSARLKTNLAALVAKEPNAKLDYIEFFEPRTLEPVSQVWRGTHMALAVFVGKTRLIDNSRL